MEPRKLRSMLSDSYLKVFKALLQGEATREELHQKTSINRKNLTIYLSRMIDEDLVRDRSKAEGVGRPLKYYSLTRRGKKLWKKVQEI